MNWIDVLLLLIIVFAALGGWSRGFIVSTADLLVWVGSILAGFFAYPYFAALIQKFIPSIGVWTTPLAFLIVVIFSRWILAMIFDRFIYHTPREAHHSTINKFFGLLPGSINGIIWVTFIAALLLAFPLGDKITAEARESKIANEMTVYVEWLDSKLSPVFDSAVNRTINNLTVDPSTTKEVKLSFKVDDAKPRPDLEAKMLELVNAERAKENLLPLKADPELVPVARAHSQDMFSRSYFSHVTPEGKTPADRIRASNVRFLTAGENLALGPTLRICHQGLMNSPGHRANILRPSYGRLGIGILDGGRYGLMITQNFRN
jgi:uncharacterized protein YkwD